ncbi:MAG: hypothetical protein C6W58_01030 [Bacillaceae bacterium]|nr:MAG: hypothetical protein C6W58_01030 [Bacillaceae bacterium]
MQTENLKKKDKKKEKMDETRGARFVHFIFIPCSKCAVQSAFWMVLCLLDFFSMQMLYKDWSVQIRSVHYKNSP